MLWLLILPNLLPKGHPFRSLRYAGKLSFSISGPHGVPHVARKIPLWWPPTTSKDKGFDILGVSLDKEKGAWVKAITDDQLTWHQVSDLKYLQNEVAVKYGVRTIPFSLLLGKDGKIIAKNLRGADLEKKIAELLQ